MKDPAYWAKRPLKWLMELLGYEIRKRRKPTAPVTPINVLPLIVRDLLATRHGPNSALFFLQIGAHDGVHFDPIRPWVEKYHWRGLLVEPQPRIFKRLTRNYRNEPQLLFENAAVYSADGEITIYMFKENQGLPDHATMLASLNRGALEFNGHGYKGEIEELTVPAFSIPKLLAKHHIEQVDLLQVDTEGYDFEIVRMFLRQTALRPAIIHYESGFSQAGQKDFDDTCEILSRSGYRVLTIGIDTIAYMQPDSNEFQEIVKNQGYDLEAEK